MEYNYVVYTILGRSNFWILLGQPIYGGGVGSDIYGLSLFHWNGEVLSNVGGGYGFGWTCI